MDTRRVERRVLRRRVTCSDLGPRGTRNSISGSGASAACEQSPPESLDAGETAERPERRPGRERLRLLVKMASAVQLFRKVTASVQRHAVQLSYDYAPPPSVLYGDYRVRPTEEPTSDRRRASLSTGALNAFPVRPCSLPAAPQPITDSAHTSCAHLRSPDIAPDPLPRERLSSRPEDTPNRPLRSNRPPITRPFRGSEPRSLATLRRHCTSADLLHEMRPLRRDRPDSAGPLAQPNPAPFPLATHHSYDPCDASPRRCASSAGSESRPRPSSTSYEVRPPSSAAHTAGPISNSNYCEIDDQDSADDEIDVTVLGDALQCHLKALMNKRSTDSADKPDTGTPSECSPVAYSAAGRNTPLNTPQATVSCPTADVERPAPSTARELLSAESTPGTNCAWPLFRIHKRKPNTLA